MPHYAAGQPGTVGPSSTHPGMFAPGTKVQVGKHRVVVEKYLSEGGFAHVYLVRDPQGDPKLNPAVLKRVAVPDKDSLASMRTEVETMKKLKGHKHIVTYVDSHASQLQGGGYEVFLLMEFCNGGGLIDFMNTRLQHRLTEPEILNIFSDVALGVACMHYLKPPLLHRDLKVENVLITTSSGSKIYKLCDFGSTAPPRPAATNATEGRLIEDDIQKHTTLQYRSPEMVDVYRRQPIDEKSDVWALGVLLYKLCYYTTPFEDQGQMAILNASFKFPSYPPFSDRLKKLISSMLRENPQQRPNIYQILKDTCTMRNADCPIQDIYANRTRSETRQYEQLPSSEPNIASPSLIGLSKTQSEPQTTANLPDITPMRRGRPTSTAHNLTVSAKVTPAGSRGTSSDPFAALDSKDAKIRSAAADELANKFPSLDEFSLLHDQGAKFEFGQEGPNADNKPGALNKRVTDALADEAFGQRKRPESITTSKPAISSDLRRVASLGRSRQQSSAVPSETRTQPLPVQPSPKHPMMVSTGVQTSPSPTPPSSKRFDVTTRPPVWRVPQGPLDGEPPSTQRSPRPLVSSFDAELPPRPERSSSRPKLLERHRTKSQTPALPSSTSERTSLEGQRPSMAELNDPINRSKSANARPRPASAFVDSNLSYLRDRELSSSRSKPLPIPPRSEIAKTGSAVADESSGDEEEPESVDSNLQFLQDLETEGSSKKKSRRSSSGKSHKKSIPSISLHGTKNIITGKFSDAFQRFERGKNREESPEPAVDDDMLRQRVLTPIAGSEATGTSGRSDDEQPLEETEDLPPEVRRELERQQLEREEQRVAAAAEEYRNRQTLGPNDRTGGAQRKGSAIQNRVKELLDSTKELQVSRTAEGYGRFTGHDRPVSLSVPAERPPIAKKPIAMSRPAVANSTGPRPLVAPKPRTLRTGGPAASPIPGDEDWETSFQNRYPSLSGLEMVETDIRPAGRIRDV